MSQISSRIGRWLRLRTEPRPTLPAPGPNPLVIGDRQITSVLIVVGGIQLWLLYRGYGPATAMEITGEVCALAAAVTGRLGATSFAALSRLMSPVKPTTT